MTQAEAPLPTGLALPTLTLTSSKFPNEIICRIASKLGLKGSKSLRICSRRTRSALSLKWFLLQYHPSCRRYMRHGGIDFALALCSAGRARSGTKIEEQMTKMVATGVVVWNGEEQTVVEALSRTLNYWTGQMVGAGNNEALRDIIATWEGYRKRLRDDETVTFFIDNPIVQHFLDVVAAGWMDGVVPLQSVVGRLNKPEDCLNLALSRASLMGKSEVALHLWTMLVNHWEEWETEIDDNVEGDALFWVTGGKFLAVLQELATLFSPEDVCRHTLPFWKKTVSSRISQPFRREQVLWDSVHLHLCNNAIVSFYLYENDASLVSDILDGLHRDSILPVLHVIAGCAATKSYDHIAVEVVRRWRGLSASGDPSRGYNGDLCKFNGEGAWFGRYTFNVDNKCVEIVDPYLEALKRCGTTQDQDQNQNDAAQEVARAYHNSPMYPGLKVLLEELFGEPALMHYIGIGALSQFVDLLPEEPTQEEKQWMTQRVKRKLISICEWEKGAILVHLLDKKWIEAARLGSDRVISSCLTLLDKCRRMSVAETNRWTMVDVRRLWEALDRNHRISRHGLVFCALEGDAGFDEPDASHETKQAMVEFLIDIGASVTSSCVKYAVREGMDNIAAILKARLREGMESESVLYDCSD